MIVSRRGAIRSQPRPVARAGSLDRPHGPRTRPVQQRGFVARSYSDRSLPHNAAHSQQKTAVLPPKATVMTAAADDNTVPQLERGKHSRFHLGRVFLGGFAALILALTGYVTFDTWQTNAKVATEYGASGSVASAKSQPTDSSNEGRDEASLPKNSLANYHVAANMPRALYIDKLKVAARVLPMSVNNDGSVQSPKNIYDAGWYNASAKPGDVGATFIDGHASGPTRQGLFAYLDTLKSGDTLRVELGDGTLHSYEVINVDTVPLANFDMNTALRPPSGTLKGLNLMTCTGKWLPDKKTYDHRVVVYTKEV